MHKYIYYILLLAFGLSQQVKSQNDLMMPPPVLLSDSAEISLLTSTPWDGQVYALFGHTAVRIKDAQQGFDGVFNYGVFNFNGPGFLFRFVKGETDYIVTLSYFKFYLKEYEDRGVSVIEQVLNLTQEEKQNLFSALMVNSLPENRVYRYNYFYDNCSTRPRDMIAKYIDGTVKYNETNKEQTYRDLVHECVAVEPWTRFGIDLVIGADADKVISDRQKDFLPLYLLHAFQNAEIGNIDGTKRNLISREENLLVSKALISERAIPADTPLIYGIVLLLIAIAISLFSYKRGRLKVVSKIFDTLLFLLAGFGGLIIFFLMFFSEHPCVNPNWNIVWLNPLQLLVALLFFVKSVQKYLSYYHFINFVALLLFLLAWCLIPQKLEIAFIPYILTIMLRSGMNFFEQNKLKKAADNSLTKIK